MMDVWNNNLINSTLRSWFNQVVLPYPKGRVSLVVNLKPACQQTGEST